MTFVTGDIFASGADFYVAPVNCVGIAGAGLAAEFRAYFFGWYKDYKCDCLCGRVKVGQALTWFFSGEAYVINFPTKNHWRDKSVLADIEVTLPYLVGCLNAFAQRSDNRFVVAIPALGCGLGSLDWADVKPLMLEHLSRVEKFDVLIYEPLI